MEETKYILSEKQSELLEIYSARRLFKDELLKAREKFSWWKRPTIHDCLEATDAAAEAIAKFWYSVRDRWPELRTTKMSVVDAEVKIID